jgi:hypothetical protein
LVGNKKDDTAEAADAAALPSADRPSDGAWVADNSNNRVLELRPSFQ